jgi:hypothetical protein
LFGAEAAPGYSFVFSMAITPHKKAVPNTESDLWEGYRALGFLRNVRLNKQMRSICGANKLYRNNSVEMDRSAMTCLAVTEVGPSIGSEAHGYRSVA